MQHLSTINNQLGAKDLFDAFKIQLAKDFEQSKFSADFVEKLEPNYGSIHEKIASELTGIEKKAGINVMQLLNRIDISDVQLKRYLDENRHQSRFHVIAELIIKRVLQKVVIRQYYKNNERNSE